MSSSSTKTLINKLNGLLKTNKKQITDWFEMLKTYTITDGKIPSLFDKTYKIKIQIETVSDTGIYNVILVWLKNNAHHFKTDDFIGIPDSNHTKISEILEAGAKNTNGAALTTKEVSPKKTFKDKKDVARWMTDPTIHPITGNPLNPFSDEYNELYAKAYNISKKKITRMYDLIDIMDMLPDKHILFGNIDVLFFINAQVAYDSSTTLMSGLMMFAMRYTKQTDTILETETEILKHLVNKKVIEELGDDSIFTFINNAIDNHIERIMSNVLINPEFDYKTTTMDDIVYYKNPRSAIDFILFLERNILSNGMIVIDFIKQLNVSWKNDYLELYEKYKNIYDDISKLLDPNSGIIENYENKKNEHILDPVDKYFTKYEKELEKIKHPKFSRFIDLTTLNPVNIEELLKPKPNKPIYLNDKDFAKFETDFKKAEEEYENKKKEYEKAKNKKTSSPKSPKFPDKPIFLLGNGILYTYGHPKPTHINDKLLEEFNIKYKDVKGIIEEYNEIKNMAYDKVVKKITDKSPTSPTKANMKENELFKMTRQQIKEKILHDYASSSLKNKCNNPMDVLTNDEFDEENYPLAKLQLMVRLEFNKKTDCAYAPALYNYWVDCVNNQQKFVNPGTRQLYSEEHKKELLKVMKIVDNNIREPTFIKPVNDTKLTIKTITVPVNIKDYDIIEGWDNITEIDFVEIKICRPFGNNNWVIYNLCAIPADINERGIFATGSLNLTSAVMLSKIISLFENGKLLSKYVPPYFNLIDEDTAQYINLNIEFNKYKSINDWFVNEDTEEPITKQEHIEMFIKYAEAINDFI
jgi:hypothetical protein